MKIILFVLLSALTASSLAEDSPQKKEVCLSTREFITTLNYLREQKDFSLPETAMRNLSEKIASGCTGASRRFIDVTNLLVKSGYPTAKTIQLAEKFALASDGEAKVFQNIFRSAFVKEILDLSLPDALDIALSLSLDFTGEASMAEEEFEKVIKFCTAERNLGLPLLSCGKLATRIVRAGADQNFKVGEEFVNLFRYLGEKSFVTKDALSISEKVVNHGLLAAENFKRAYEFALEKEGLGLPQKDATTFALKMGALSEKEARTSKSR